MPGRVLSVLFGDEPGRANFTGLWRAFLQLPRRRRVRAGGRAAWPRIDDTEAFRRPLGGYFRDRFDALRRPSPRASACCSSRRIPSARRCTAAACSCTRRCASWRTLCDVHVIALLDHPDQLPANEELREFCASTEFLVRMEGEGGTGLRIVPHAVREYSNPRPGRG